MYERLLFPTDGTRPTDAVLEHARDVAGRRDAAVHVLYVVDDRSFLLLDDDRTAEVSRQLRAEGERATAAAAAAFEEDGLEVTTEIRTGTPASEIVTAVEKQGADLVVMGTHGDDPTENLLGSTAQRVVTHSPVPVLTVGLAGSDDGGAPETTGVVDELEEPESV